MISYAVALFFALNKINFLFDIIKKINELITPFTYGFVIAYILNKPYNFFLNKVFKEKLFSKKKIFLKPSLNVRKCFSILISYSIFISILVFIVAIVIPQMVESCTKFAQHLSYTLSDGESVVYHGLKFLGFDPSMETYVIEILSKFVGGLEKFSATMLLSIYDILTKFMLEFYYWTLGLVISVYLLFGKEKLLLQLRKIKDAFLPKKISDHITEILRISHKKIGKFLVGKILNSLLIGILCFIGVTILKFPYSVLISVVVGVTNIIPFFGPVFGAIPSILIVLTVNPMQAFYLGIFLLALQQLDGNFIGPRILGSATGISGIWIMFSVIVGGGFFGISGMILGVPIFSVIYMLTGKYVNKKLYGSNKI
jgi:predicted PurR-regulated permease PerM